MKNLIINNLYIEVTRNCTMNCAHCLRGEKEKINLNINDIDNLFSNNNINIIKIKKLTITGGEPTLNPQVILEIIKKIISKQIDIEHFIMVINGSIYNQSLIDGLNTFYEYYHKKRLEGKCHRVALSHVCRKIIRIIYILETKNIQFDPSLLR